MEVRRTMASCGHEHEGSLAEDVRGAGQDKEVPHDRPGGGGKVDDGKLARGVKAVQSFERIEGESLCDDVEHRGNRRCAGHHVRLHSYGVIERTDGGTGVVLADVVDVDNAAKRMHRRDEAIDRVRHAEPDQALPRSTRLLERYFLHIVDLSRHSVMPKVDFATSPGIAWRIIGGTELENREASSPK
jgi:hypothetical protein